jgi:hypothetical protein
MHGYYAHPWYGPYVGQQPVAQLTRVEVLPAPDLTANPHWPGARALVRSTIQSVLGVDAIFDQIFRQIVQHLVHQGFIDQRTAGHVNRSDYVAKVRAWVRQALYYADIDAIIDLATRQLIQYARLQGKGPFG